MQRKIALVSIGFLIFGGCDTRPKTAYASLDQAGMWSSSLDDLKRLKPSDQEIAQLTKLKQARASDDLCLALLKIAHERHQEFNSAEAAINLSRAGYPDPEILELERSGKIDILSDEAVTMKLVGLSSASVQIVLHRRMQNLPTLTSAQIGRLKNTGLSEKQIMELVEQGISGQQAETLVAQREALRDHSNTGFVRNRGRRLR